MPRPTLVYDGDCSACTRLARFVERRLRPDADVLAWQQADLGRLGLTPQQCDAALQWVDPDGAVHSAQDAVAALLLASRAWVRPAGRALRLPGVNPLAGSAYRWVAAHRHLLPGGTSACSVPARRVGG